MSEEVYETAAPFGKKGSYPSSGPENDRQSQYRYGIDVEGDRQGPQHLGTETSLSDAARAARVAAENRREQISALGLSNTVVPWIQQVTIVTKVIFAEHQVAPGGSL
ncbi:hypothetical protein [Rhodococcoides fascians]|uniref:hypothetical protein n=1 Tax=Rhodococcoides fascians TaxID=1828 RepID=UPI00050C1277|nr:hypothetical protein [Rhodococcus fascians]